MTWAWTIGKFVFSTALGAISCNPIGWVVGGTTSVVTKMYIEEDLNSSTLTLSDKVMTSRAIQFIEDYQLSLLVGVAGQGAGKILTSKAGNIAKETAKIGKDASKEIAKNGWTSLARGLKETGVNLAKKESNYKYLAKASGWAGAKEFFCSAVDAGIRKLMEVKTQEEFFQAISNLLELIEQGILEAKSDLIENKDELNLLRSNLLEINNKNVEYYIKKGEEFDQHREINKKINKLLKEIKECQSSLHKSENCCEKCRFC